MVCLDVKQDDVKARINYLPLVFEWDLVEYGDKKGPLPNVHSTEHRTLILNGQPEQENQLFEQTYELGKTDWVRAFTLKKNTKNGKAITRIIYFDAPGMLVQIGSRTLLTINFNVGLRDPNQDRNDPFSSFYGKMQMVFSGNTLRWAIVHSDSMKHNIYHNEETKECGGYPLPK